MTDRCIEEGTLSAGYLKLAIASARVSNDVHINTYIDEMDGHYEVLYRTQDRVMGLMKKTHNVPLVTTVYPVPFDENGTSDAYCGLSMLTGLTFGVWDLCHNGHLNFLQRCRERCDRLIVGVCGDEMTEMTKGRKPIFTANDRLCIILALKVVDKAFIYNKPHYKEWFKEVKSDILFVGEDFGFQGIPEHHEVMETVKYERLPRTPDISTTALRRYCESVRHLGND